MKLSKAVKLVLFSLIFSTVLMSQAYAACTLPATSHADNITALSDLLPGDARGALAVDIEGLLAGSSATRVNALLNGTGNGDPVLKELFGAINKLAEYVNLNTVMDTAFLAQTTDASDGLFLLAKTSCELIGDVALDVLPDGVYGSHAMYLDLNGNSLSLLTDGVLIVGKLAAVQSVLDVVDGTSPANDSDIDPFKSALQSGSPFSFIYGLPAMDKAITPDDSLRGAKLVSGSLDFAGANISGSVSFHTSNASAYVDKYNDLNVNAIYAGEAELALNGPVANGLSQVEVTIPSTPINKTSAQLLNSRNTLKKLIIGMNAWDHAKDVEDGNKPYLAMTVLGEDLGAKQPGSVFIRWEFKDDADFIDPDCSVPGPGCGRGTTAAFNEDELPPGYELTDCQFLDTDTPSKYMVLNLYHGSGGSVFEGVRAEWDTFVKTPVGADPDESPRRTRFMLRDALASAVSFTPMHGMTSPEPLTYQLVGNNAEIYVGKMEGDTQIDVFEAVFPKPDPISATVVRFAREMAISNDYIYYGNGVYDRAEYNASTVNYDSYLVEPLSGVQITRNDHWAQYLADDPTYLVYYTNMLEYTVTPMDNLDSTHLNFMFNPTDWIDELIAFKYNGHEKAWMTGAVEELFKGKNDTMASFFVENTTPATYYHFQIDEPALMEEALNLPQGYSLAQTHFFDEPSPTEDYYLTLSLYDIAGSIEGTRAEWSVYVDDENDGIDREHMMIIDLQTEDAALDPVSMINLPSLVEHELAGGTISTSLSSMTIDFDANFDTADATVEAVSLDWIEAGERPCHLNGICDKLYYDAETLDVPVLLPLPASVTATVSTPWDAYINTVPSAVFFRNNTIPHQYVIKPWQNLKVEVDDPPPPPICFEGTHTITGTGTMIGRTSSAVDSTYTYYGGGTLSGDILDFYLDQTIQNVLGESHMIFSVSLDIGTAEHTQELLSCTSQSILMCAEANPIIGTAAAISIFDAENLNTADMDNITWDVNFEVEIAAMGTADSASSYTAALGDPMQAEICNNGVDDDCDGFLDCKDSDCVDDVYCNSWLTPASVVNSECKESSDMANYIFLMCIPVGALLLWKGLRRRK